MAAEASGLEHQQHVAEQGVGGEETALGPGLHAWGHQSTNSRKIPPNAASGHSSSQTNKCPSIETWCKPTEANKQPPSWPGLPGCQVASGQSLHARLQQLPSRLWKNTFAPTKQDFEPTKRHPTSVSTKQDAGWAKFCTSQEPGRTVEQTSVPANDISAHLHYGTTTAATHVQNV